jgi:hypothetical protein
VARKRLMIHTVVVWNHARTKMLTGSYAVRDGIITVTSELGKKATQVGGSPPKVLARMMLRELADDADRGFSGPRD